MTLDRSFIEQRVRRHIVSWEAGDVTAISRALHPDVEFMLPGAHWQGQTSIHDALSAQLAEWQALRFYVRRLLVDPAQQVAAIEWISRSVRPRENGCRELLGGLVLDFDSTGLIWRWRIYLDPVRQRSLPHFDAPWLDEGWSPSPNPGPPPSPVIVEQIVRAYSRVWASHDVAQFDPLIHDEMIIQPPWDFMNGRAAFEAGARVYFANYTDTQVTPHRLILDPTQPYFGVCQQTFACTNRDTGRRGEDHDFAFFEIAQGRLRYWRTYFDTTRSAQVVEKTAGFQSSQATSLT